MVRATGTSCVCSPGHGEGFRPETIHEHADRSATQGTHRLPDSDGQPLADNTLQFQRIVTIEGGLDALFRDDPNVFVAGDLLWYPVEGDNTTRQAPAVLVVFGRPKGYRGSYRQWEEGGLAPQVVFEILSPGNRIGAMIRRFHFYERYGVEEYYIYDPDDGELTGYLREGTSLREIPSMQGWVSPRLGVRFELVNGELRLYGPDDRRFPAKSNGRPSATWRIGSAIRPGRRRTGCAPSSRPSGWTRRKLLPRPACLAVGVPPSGGLRPQTA